MQTHQHPVMTQDRVLASPYIYSMSFPGDSELKNPPAKQEKWSSTPESGRSPGDGNSYHSEYSYLKSHELKTWWATATGLQKSLTQLSN